MEMLMRIFQSIGAIVVGAFIGWEIGKLILIAKLNKEEQEQDKEEE